MVTAWLALAGNARAEPPNRVVLMAPGIDRFEPGPQGNWTVISTDPKVVTAQYFKTAEVHLEALAPGKALLVFCNRVIRTIQVWKVRVEDQVPQRLRSGTEVLRGKCSCPQPAVLPLVCQVQDEACLEALAAVFAQGDWETEDLELNFNLAGLQNLLKRLRGGLDRAGFKEIEVAFLGANLQLKGSVADLEAYRRLVLAAYQVMVGMLNLDDQVEILSERR
jgi:hypothetical protein